MFRRSISLRVSALSQVSSILQVSSKLCHQYRMCHQSFKVRTSHGQQLQLPLLFLCRHSHPPPYQLSSSPLLVFSECFRIFWLKCSTFYQILTSWQFLFNWTLIWNGGVGRKWKFIKNFFCHQHILEYKCENHPACYRTYYSTDISLHVFVQMQKISWVIIPQSAEQRLNLQILREEKVKVPFHKVPLSKLPMSPWKQSQLAFLENTLIFFWPVLQLHSPFHKVPLILPYCQYHHRNNHNLHPQKPP